MSSGDRGPDPPTQRRPDPQDHTELTDPSATDERSRRRDRGGTALATRPGERDHALVRRFTLLVTVGPDGGEKYVSTGERMVIGTHPSCDVVLHDATVSRFHCEIAVGSRSVFIRDLESASGTVVDNQPVLEGTLRGGAVLALGGTQIRFDTGGEPVSIPLPLVDRFGALVGSSAPMRRLFAQLERAAASAAAVLIDGEAGSGKSTAVQSLHAAGPRAGGPFVVVDCQTVRPAVLEGELLGDDGAFAVARGGTLHLREVGDIPVELHPRLAAAIDAHRGAVRTVASTRRSLRSEVNGRRFRSELYQRVGAIECRMPALRERPDDLAPLIEDVLTRIGAAASPAAARLRTREVQSELGRHAWPGNVRELAELVVRMVGATVVPPSDEIGALPLSAARASWTASFERGAVERALAAHSGDPIAAAPSTGLDSLRFGQLLDRIGLRVGLRFGR